MQTSTGGHPTIDRQNWWPDPKMERQTFVHGGQGDTGQKHAHISTTDIPLNNSPDAKVVDTTN
jgi:hypothetical protein